jgi:hypothetical protein
MSEDLELRQFARIDDVQLSQVTELSAVEELFDAITAVDIAAKRHFRRVRRRPGHHRRALSVALVAVIVAVVGSVLFVSSRAKSPVAHVAATHWRLMRYVGWNVGASGSATSGGLTCPTATTCYVTGSSGNVATGLIPIDSLYVSNDGGSTWSAPRSLPAGVTFTTTVTCPSQNDCLAGGFRSDSTTSGSGPPDGQLVGTAVLLHTSDGGQTWQQSALPQRIGRLHAITCPTSGICYALANASAVASATTSEPLYLGIAQPTTFLATTNNGQTWISSRFPAQDTVALLSCPTASKCVAGGIHYTTGLDATTQQTTQIFATTNSGRTWSLSSLSSDTTSLDALACPSSSVCFAVGSQNVPTSPTTGRCPLPSCTSPDGITTVSRVYNSADGAQTWQSDSWTSTLPDIDIDLLSCPTVSQCWVSGSDAVPYVVRGPEGGVGSSSSPLVLSTTNGGGNWMVDPVPDAVYPGNSLATPGQFGSLQCPTTADCVALGGGLPSTRDVPVFRLGG